MTIPIRGSWTLDKLIEAYESHQRRTRGLRASTLHHYQRLVRRFVRAALRDDRIDPSHLRPSDVIEFVDSMRSRFSPHFLNRRSIHSGRAHLTGTL